MDTRILLRWNSVNKLELWIDEGNGEGHWSNDDERIASYSDDGYDQILAFVKDRLNHPVVLGWMISILLRTQKETVILIQCGFFVVLPEYMKLVEITQQERRSSFLENMFLDSKNYNMNHIR